MTELAIRTLRFHKSCCRARLSDTIAVSCVQMYLPKVILTSRVKGLLPAASCHRVGVVMLCCCHAGVVVWTTADVERRFSPPSTAEKFVAVSLLLLTFVAAVVFLCAGHNHQAASPRYASSGTTWKWLP
jgi:hypothetical protein